jgi:hypothetical protein
MYAMCPDRHACRSWFENKVEKHRSALRCLNYPDQVPPPTVRRMRLCHLNLSRAATAA